MENKVKDYVYIFTNESFRDDLVKIGTSTLPVDKLIEELDTEDMPTPYKPYAIIQTDDFELFEEHIHQLLDKIPEKHWNKELGFYKLHPAVAIGLLSNTLAELRMKDSVVILYDNGEPRQLFPPIDAPQARIKDAPSKE